MVDQSFETVTKVIHILIATIKPDVALKNATVWLHLMVVHQCTSARASSEVGVSGKSTYTGFQGIHHLLGKRSH